MSEMLDRVSNAMADHFKQIIEIASGGPFSESGVTLPAKYVWEGYAEAAIKEMREPTDAMQKAGYLETVDDETWVWKVMIDAALTP